MPNKRGRPLVETDDPVVRQRRERTAQRTREYYARLRAARAATALVTSEQLQQGERIADLGFTDEDTDAAVTLTQLGLRVEGLALPQDASEARLQEGAAHVDEHDALYNNHDSGPAEETRCSQPRTSTHRPGLTRFFSTLPPSNPFTAPSVLEPRLKQASQPIPPDARDSTNVPPHTPILRPPPIPQGSEDFMFGESDVDRDTEETVKEDITDQRGVEDTQLQDRHDEDNSSADLRLGNG